MAEIIVQDEIAAKYFKSGWDAAIREYNVRTEEPHISIDDVWRELCNLRADLTPLIEMFKALPQVLEESPMLGMIFGRLAGKK